MQSFRVEYLVTVDQSVGFCNTVTSFVNLLRTIDEVVVGNDTIDHGSVSFRYDIQTGEVSSDEHRFFHLRTVCINEDQLDEFDYVLRLIRSVLCKTAGKPPQVLWDDISFYYAQKAYPLIHEIENTMRKLITKFMLINIGLGWTSAATPKEVAESLHAKAKKGTQNYLYEVDFIQLSNFLFKEYATTSTKNVLERLKKANETSDLALSDLQGLIPRSNWERYFSEIVDCESDYFRIRWERLYERRNQVAHNKPFSKTEFEEVVRFIQELKPTLQQALEGLDQIAVSDEERENVAEEAATTKDLRYSDFIRIWNRLQTVIYELALVGAATDEERKHISERMRHNVRGLLNIITKDQRVLPREFKTRVIEVYKVRNIIVHESEWTLPDETIQQLIEKTLSFIDEVNFAIQSVQSNQTTNCG